MARGGCVKWGCCLSPIIILVIIVGGIFGVYMWLPVGTTFGVADDPFILEYSMNDLGIADKSVRDFLHTPIGELGNIGSIELVEGFSLSRDLGLEDVTLWDLTKKPIEELGGLGDVDLLKLILGLSKTDSELKLSDGDTDAVGTPSLEDILENMEGFTLNSVGLGPEKLIDLSLKNLIGIIMDGDDPMILLPILHKPIGELGNGQFKETDLFSFIPVSVLEDMLNRELAGTMELPDDINLEDIHLKIKDITFNSPDRSVLNMSLRDLFSSEVINDVNVEGVFESVLGGIMDSLLIPQEEIEETVIEEDFKEGNFNQQNELNNANDALTNTDAGSGIPTKQNEEGEEEVDYLEIFKEPVVFERQALIILKDTEFTAIFNQIILGGGEDYQELRDLEATIRQVYLPGRVEGVITVKTTLTIKTATLKNSGYDLGMLEKMLPETLYLTVVTVITTDEVTGDVVYSSEVISVRIENMTESVSSMLLKMEVEGDTFEAYVNKLVGELFCTFVNNLGSVGTAGAVEGEFVYGESGIESARQISVVTRVAAEEEGGALPDAA